MWKLKVLLPGLAKEEAKHVCHDVIADDERDGQEEPDKSFEHVLDHQVGLGDDE